MLPNIGASIEFSIGRIRSKLDRFNFDGSLSSTESIDGTDVGIGFNIGALWHPMKEMGVTKRVTEIQKFALWDGTPFDAADPEKYATSFPVNGLAS